MTVNVVDIRDISKDAFGNFVRQHPSGSIFESPEMFDSFSGTNDYEPVGVAAVNQNEEIEGVIIGYINKYFNFVSRTVVYGGPLVSNRSVIPLLLKGFDENIIKKSPIPLTIDIRNMWNNEDYRSEFENAGYFLEDHLNYIIPLNGTTDSIMHKIPKDRRKNILRGISTFSVKDVETKKEIDVAYDLIVKTYLRAKVPGPSKELLEKAYESLKPSKYIKWIIASNGDIPVATRIFLTYKDCIYDWYAGSLYNNDAQYSNEFLVWIGLKYGAENGFNHFDFGGAGNPSKPYGPREFKRRFGGVEVNWGIYRKVFNPSIWWLVRNIAKVKYPGISKTI